VFILSELEAFRRFSWQFGLDKYSDILIRPGVNLQCLLLEGEAFRNIFQDGRFWSLPFDRRTDKIQWRLLNWKSAVCSLVDLLRDWKWILLMQNTY